jgi:hypothetical protein
MRPFSEQGTSTSDASTPSPRPTPTSGGQDADASNGTQIRITSGNTELTGRLRDNATARGLAEQLPLTLTFSDHNDAEKTASLPRELAVDEAPAGHALLRQRRTYFDGIVASGWHRSSSPGPRTA